MTVAAIPGAGITAIVVRPGPEVLEFQARLIGALAPARTSSRTSPSASPSSTNWSRSKPNPSKSTFSPAGISVYQLGNNGTAAKHLKSWTT
jgi:hypothetical protein